MDFLEFLIFLAPISATGFALTYMMQRLPEHVHLPEGGFSAGLHYVGTATLLFVKGLAIALLVMIAALWLTIAIVT